MFLPLRPRGDEGEDAGDRCEDDELRGQGAHSGKDEDDDDDDVAMKMIMMVTMGSDR